jgi:hypothetical protein
VLKEEEAPLTREPLEEGLLLNSFLTELKAFFSLPFFFSF